MVLCSFSFVLVAMLTPAAAEGIVVVWLFAMGGAVGSFLNVVIYRLPAGKSLVFPGSHCPACEHPIRWHDNVPVLSWLALHGRCRDCGSKIALRYPLVEGVTAGLFVVVGVVEGLWGGANLPLRPVVSMDGAVLPPLGIGQSAAMVSYHLLLLCTLLAAALIEYDGHRAPVRLFVPALVLGWLAPLAWPYLHPVAGPRAVLAGSISPVAAVIDGTAGLALGTLLGLACLQLPGTGRSTGLLWALACVGLFLGWQAVLPVTVTTLLVHLVVSGIRHLAPRLRAVPPTAWLALSALGWVLAWGWIVGRLTILG